MESVFILIEKGVDEPVVSHEEPGATDHSSVEWDVVFDRILSILGLSPRVYVLFSRSFYLIIRTEGSLKKHFIHGAQLVIQNRIHKSNQ